MVRRLRLKCDGTRTQTRFCISSIKGRVHLNRRGRQFSRLLAGELCTSACRVCTVRASLCVLQSCDAYWLPTPFSCFPFTSPPVRHRVPSHFNWTLPSQCMVKTTQNAVYARKSNIAFPGALRVEIKKLVATLTGGRAGNWKLS